MKKQEAYFSSLLLSSVFSENELWMQKRKKTEQLKSKIVTRNKQNPEERHRCVMRPFRLVKSHS